MAPTPVRSRATRIVIAVIFALTPWLSLGFATPAAFGVVAALMRSWWLGAAAVGYAAAFVALFITADAEGGTTGAVVFGWSLATLMLIGGVHAAIVSPFLARSMRAAPAPTALPRSDSVDQVVEKIAAESRADLAHDPALRLAVKQQEQRRVARTIVKKHPSLADELGIGRPDHLERKFDDGGLIDVNQVPVWVLTTLDGVDYDLAKRIVAVRQRHGPFSSVEDLIVYADVPHDVIHTAREVLLFRQPHTDLLTH